MGVISDIINNNRQIVCKSKDNHFKFCDKKGKTLLTVRENGFVEVNDGVSFDLVGYAHRADKEGNRTFVGRGNKVEAVYNVNSGKFILYDENEKPVSERNVMIEGKTANLDKMKGSRFVPAYNTYNPKSKSL